MSLILWLTLFFVVIVVSNLITHKQSLSKEDKKLYVYKKKSKIMTDHEHSFYLILDEALGQNYYILAQAHLSSFLDEKVEGQSWKGAFKHINGKSIDY
jgi:cbb3-type cytochrome oxidase subunit 3